MIMTTAIVIRALAGGSEARRRGAPSAAAPASACGACVDSYRYLLNRWDYQ